MNGIICFIAFMAALGFLIWTISLAAGYNYWCFATVLAMAGCLVICVLSLTPRERTHTISDVKTVQIDTVITTCNHISDTTYVIKYLK